MKKFKTIVIALLCVFSICFWGCKSESSISGEEEIIAGNRGEKVSMGSWPQSLADVTGITLTATGKVYDGNNAEFSGDDGNKYVKVRSSYYKVEPITWRVIAYKSGGSKILLADKIYTALSFYGYDSFFANNPRERSLAGKKIFPNNYKYSNIRAYLNSSKNQYEIDGGTPTEYDVDWTNAGFLTTAFTSSEIAKIKTTLVDNSAETTASSTNQYVCENTEDKVFLLSYKDATEEMFGFNKKLNKIMHVTDYAKAIGTWSDEDIQDYFVGYWWLRSPDYEKNYVSHYIDYDGDYAEEYEVSEYGIGLVPAITVRD